MKIEAGKFYRTRDGRKVGPAELRNDRWSVDSGFPWAAGTGFMHYPSGKCAYENAPHLDLISEWVDAPTGPVREVTRKEIVPGIYGRVQVLSGPDERTPNAVQIQVHLGSIGAPHLWLNAAELRAAADVLTQLADALDAQS